MNTYNRMSPLTALILGLFGVGAVGIAAGTTIVIYTLRVADGELGTATELVGRIVDEVSDVLGDLPGGLGDLAEFERSPKYGQKVDVTATIVPSANDDRARLVLTISNRGDEVISGLAVRVTAMDERGVPVADWTEVVATPIAIDDDAWRGPMMPGATRHISLSTYRGLFGLIDGLTTQVEISDVWVWNPDKVEGLTSASGNI